MDTALTLRIKADNGENIPLDEATGLLEQSALVQKLTANFVPKPTFAVWRLLALAEIPFAQNLPYTQQVLEYVRRHISCDCGFSLYGNQQDFLPCYNAMLLEAYCKLGLAGTEEAGCALQWILDYQRFERGTPTLWKEKGIQKHGGCLNDTPCYIGVAKGAAALAWYQKTTGGKNKVAAQKLDSGMQYLLQHRLYQRLSNGQPINNHMLDLAFPQSYQLNVVELLQTAKLCGVLQHPACAPALAYVQGKRRPDGYWKVSHVYSGEGYVSFDAKGKPALWLTHVLGRLV